MQALLYLVHRIPFPPDKGDKIRSYHLLQHLTGKFNVHVGTFIDDDNDLKYQDQLRQICAEVFVERLEPVKSTFKSASGFFTGKALTLPYYGSSAMQEWVDATIAKNNIRQVVVFSSAMAQYIDSDDKQRLNRVIDFVDVDSEKWRQYSESKLWPMNWLYKREAKYLLEFESHIANTCNASLFVSKEEAFHFQRIVGNAVNNIDYFCNGVDTDYFSSEHEFTSPFPNNIKPIVFTGAMDYWANVDAVTWFAKEVFSQLYTDDETLRFYIVGSNPSSQVTTLAKEDGVVVTGRVPDVRPYLAHACFATAPMRIARGVQNKVLEAMAMGCQVAVTTAGAEGITAKMDVEWLIADTAAEMIAAAKKLLYSQSNSNMGQKARDFVTANYNWEVNLARLDSLLQA